VARLKLEVVNSTDTTFTGVRIEALLPADLAVTDWPDDMRRDGEPPAPPPLYGQGTGLGLGLYRGIPAISSHFVPHVPFACRTPEVERRTDGTYVEYVPEDVRAQGVTPLPSVWLCIEDPSVEAIPVQWEATATTADKRLSGTFSVPVARPPVPAEQLMADVRDDED
jgi:hypothetical protein